MSNDPTNPRETAKYGVAITPEVEKTAQDAPQAPVECVACHQKLGAADHKCPEALN